MRAALWIGLGILGFVAPAAAWADETQPPPPPTEAPALAPTPDEGRRVVEMAPPEGAPVAPAPAPVLAPPMAAPGSPCNPCGPCGPQPCRQRRDECGWPLDACGSRMGAWDLTLEGMASWFSDPDGNLGEIVDGNTDPLHWNGLDYPTVFGGRGTISYRYDAPSRIELRGTYWGNPDETTTDSGFFGATPGALGVGDLSRPVDATFTTESEMWGLELNWWTEVMCKGSTRIDVGFGARYVSFDEFARVDFVTTGPIGNFPVATNGFVTSDVENDFIGGQLLFACHQDVSDCLTLSATLKGLVGQVTRDIRVTDDSIFAGGLHGSASEDDEFVWGMDVELGLAWRIASRFTVTLGYELFLLDGVQRAEDAMDFSRSTTGAVQASQTPDQVFTHSFFLGVGVNF